LDEKLNTTHAKKYVTYFFSKKATMWLSNEWQNRWSFFEVFLFMLWFANTFCWVNWMHYGALDKLGKILGMWNCFACALGQ
jgi:hypothetical protein